MVNIKKLFSKENRNKTLALGLTGLVLVGGIVVFSMRKTLNVVVNGEKRRLLPIKVQYKGLYTIME